MKRLVVALTIALTFVLAATMVFAAVAFAGPGNGAPSGAHYNLNIIGVPKEKSADMDGNNGHRIFVPLEGKASIWLKEGDFAVLDANGTDRDGASFQLPDPDVDGDGVIDGTYTVWVRALGKPGGHADMTTCATVDGEVWCPAITDVSESGDPIYVTLDRFTGKSSFTNVTNTLLYLYVNLDDDAKLERVPLFDPAFSDYFWSYDNQGLKLAQFRFYWTPSAE